MSAAVVVTPASGSITHLVTAVNTTCTGATANTTTGYDTTKYPSEPAVVYYFKWALAGQNSLYSPRFSPSESGTAEWNDLIIPAAGTWTVTLNDNADDSVKATASVVVA